MMKLNKKTISILPILVGINACGVITMMLTIADKAIAITSSIMLLLVSISSNAFILKFHHLERR